MSAIPMLAATEPPPVGDGERIAALAADFSCEVAARDDAAIEAAATLLPPGTRVSVTWMPRDDDDARVLAARRLREAGLEPVPHLAARMLEGTAQLDRLLARLRAEAGVRELLAIGGDAKSPAGPFGDAGAMLAAPAFATAGLRRVWLGGYPEGHPRIADPALRDALDAKIARLGGVGIAAGIITQFCFAAPPILAFAQSLRARHPDVPLRIGLAGPAGVRTLLRFARICGVGASTRAILSHGASIARLLGDAAPDPILAALAAADAQQRLAPLALHYFPFGGLERTARWANAVAAGRIRLRSGESGFAVLPD